MTLKPLKFSLLAKCMQMKTMKLRVATSNSLEDLIMAHHHLTLTTFTH